MVRSSDFPHTPRTSGDLNDRHLSHQVVSHLSVSRSDTLFVSGSFDDPNIPKSRYPGLITIAHTREDGTDGERCENGTHKMEGCFVCWRSMLQMIDDVLDIDMIRSC